MGHLFRIELQHENDDDLRVNVMTCLARIRHIILHICILRLRRQGVYLVETRQKNVRKRAPRVERAVEEPL